MSADQSAATETRRPPVLRKPVTEAVLRELTARIVARRPDATVILFGSRARGDAQTESDVDLLVITDTDQNPLQVAGEIYLEVGDRDFGLDLVVMTPARFERKRRGADPFVRDIVAQGRVLHGSIDGPS